MKGKRGRRKGEKKTREWENKKFGLNKSFYFTGGQTVGDQLLQCGLLLPATTERFISRGTSQFFCRIWINRVECYLRYMSYDCRYCWQWWDIWKV